MTTKKPSAPTSAHVHHAPVHHTKESPAAKEVPVPEAIPAVEPAPEAHAPTPEMQAKVDAILHGVCTTCGNPVSSGETCVVDGTRAA